MLRLHFDDLTQQVVMLRLHFDWLSLLLVGKHRVSHFFGLEIAKVLEVVLLFIFFAFTLVESLFDFLSFDARLSQFLVLKAIHDQVPHSTSRDA
jgi:hypothetical protein